MTGPGMPADGLSSKQAVLAAEGILDQVQTGIVVIDPEGRLRYRRVDDGWAVDRLSP